MNYISIARGFKDERNDLKALKFYKKAYNTEFGKKDIELIYDLALMFDKLGQRDLAKKKYEEVLKIDNKEARAYYGIGTIFDEEEDYKEAIKYYKRAIEIDDKYDRAYFFLSNAYDEMGEKETAIKLYKKTLELVPNDLWANANLGCILEEVGENEDALKYLKKALEINPTHFRILFNMGVVLGKLNKIEEAKKYYEMSIEEDEFYPYSYLNLAVLYKNEGDYLKGIDILSNGILNNPEQGFLYYNRACFLVHLKNYRDALMDVAISIKCNEFFREYAIEDKELLPLKELENYKSVLGEKNEL
ncbi:MAG: tetratricopeptide repeat protein [Clostridium sp.]